MNTPGVFPDGAESSAGAFVHQFDIILSLGTISDLVEMVCWMPGLLDAAGIQQTISTATTATQVWERRLASRCAVAPAGHVRRL